jgi:hypothetical protein
MDTGRRDQIVPGTADELGQLLHERFGLHTADLVAALRTLPANRPPDAALPEDIVRLLDGSDLPEDASAHAESAANIVTRMALLINTAYRPTKSPMRSTSTPPGTAAAPVSLALGDRGWRHLDLPGALIRVR